MVQHSEKLSPLPAPKSILIVVFSVLLLLTLNLFNYTVRNIFQENLVKQSQSQFQKVASDQAFRIQMQFHEYEESLDVGHMLFSFQKHMSRAQFEQFFTLYMDEHREMFPGIDAMLYVESVPISEEGEYIQKIKSDKSTEKNGFPFFTIFPRETSEKERMVVNYMAPFDSHFGLFGYDMNTDPYHKKMLEKARTTSEMQISEKVALLNKEFVVLYKPVVRGKDNEITGFLVALVAPDVAFGVEQRDGTDVHLTVVERVSHALVGEYPPGFYGIRKQNYPYREMFPITVGGKVFDITIYSDEMSQMSPLQRYGSDVILYGGGALSILIVGVIFTLIYARNMALMMADGHFRKLQHHESLYKIIAESMTDCVAVMDKQDNVLYMNNAVCELGISKEKAGTVNPFALVHKEDRGRIDQIKNAIFDTKTPQSTTIRVQKQDGNYVLIDLTGSPVLNEKGKVEMCVYVGHNLGKK